jgi:hypothetical protein
MVVGFFSLLGNYRRDSQHTHRKKQKEREDR